MTESVTAELDRLENWLSGVMASISPQARTRATRAIHPLLRKSAAARIAAQREPDGSGFAPRKNAKPQKPSNVTKKFMYPSGGSGEPRVVLLKSWVARGGVITGFDREADGFRSFTKSKVVQWLVPSPEERNKSARPLRTRPTIKARLMFRKIRMFSYLKSGATPGEAWVGFSGEAARIARVHQDGLADRVAPKAPMTRYARRQLLGLTKAEEDQILTLLVEQFDAR